VSVREHRIRNAIFIGVVGGIGIALTVWGATRSDIAQTNLENELAAIKQNTEKPQPSPIINVNPPAVNFPPQQAFVGVVGRGLVQFKVPESIVVDFTTANESSSVSALNEYEFDRIYIAETEKLGPNGELLVSKAAEEKYYKQFLETISKIHPTDSRTIGPQQNFVSSGFGPRLDNGLKNEIELGSKAVFHAMEFVWRDQAGQHINEACEWLQPQSFTVGKPFVSGQSEVWHFCQGHNGLKK
jgi:hypothetical protein